MNIKRVQFGRQAAVLALAAGLLHAPTVCAEEAGAASQEADGDIIVTAQKRSERLSDVPISLTAATGEQKDDHDKGADHGDDEALARARA